MIPAAGTYMLYPQIVSTNGTYKWHLQGNKTVLCNLAGNSEPPTSKRGRFFIEIHLDSATFRSRVFEIAHRFPMAVLAKHLYRVVRNEQFTFLEA